MKKILILLTIIIYPLLFLYSLDNKVLKLTFLGDIMVHDTNFMMNDYNKIYSSVKDILKSDDLTFANIEFPICPKLSFSTYPRFNAKPVYVKAAIDAAITTNGVGDITGAILNVLLDLMVDGALMILSIFDTMTSNCDSKQSTFCFDCFIKRLTESGIQIGSQPPTEIFCNAVGPTPNN